MKSDLKSFWTIYFGAKIVPWKKEVNHTSSTHSFLETGDGYCTTAKSRVTFVCFTFSVSSYCNVMRQSLTHCLCMCLYSSRLVSSRLVSSRLVSSRLVSSVLFSLSSSSCSCLIHIHYSRTHPHVHTYKYTSVSLSLSRSLSLSLSLSMPIDVGYPVATAVMPPTWHLYRNYTRPHTGNHHHHHTMYRTFVPIDTMDPPMLRFP